MAGPLRIIDPVTFELDRAILHSARLEHQPAYARNAVRKAARLQSQNSLSTAHTSTIKAEEVPIRNRLLARIANLAPNDESNTQLTGVLRQVRHAGVYNAGRNVGVARTEQKQVVRSVVIKV